MLTNWTKGDDFENIFGMRPEEVAIEVHRSAFSQPGQNNGISKKKIDANDLTIAWDEETDIGAWSYTVTADGDTLEKYAPNGMPWKYYVKEIVDKDSEYTVSPSGDEVSALASAAKGDVLTLNNITNSIAASIPYSKIWVDEDGSEIDEDNIGKDITVEFRLQVAEEPLNDWQDAETYFKGDAENGTGALLEEDYNEIFSDYKFTSEVTGRIDADVWGDNSFDDLPKLIKKAGDENTTQLKYCVVESSIKYGDKTQTVTVKDAADGSYTYEFGTGMFTPAYPDGQDSYSDADKAIYNGLQTVDLKVTKEWRGVDDPDREEVTAWLWWTDSGMLK